MKEIRVKSIVELEKQVKEIMYDMKSSKNHDFVFINDLIFRGQSNSDWALETTLERFSNEKFSVESYNNKLCDIFPAASSFLNENWKIENKPVIKNDQSLSSLPNYDFMVHARHHGFPTPILDWTRSIYIALYFAFCDSKPSNDIAVFAYRESLNGGKSGFVGSPSISLTGPYIRTHKRHHIQQAQYTFACKWDENERWEFCPHEEVFRENNSNQDLLYKFIIRGSLKKEVLEKLDSMNVNAFTLFGSEDSLFQMLAYREINK